MNITSVLEISEFKLHYINLFEIDNTILLEITKNKFNKIYCLLALASESSNFDNHSYAENYEYAYNFLNQILNLYEVELEFEHKQLCLAYLLRNCFKNKDIVEFYNDFNKYKDVEVSEEDWLWVIRETLRYKLLSCLNSPMLNNSKEMSELINLLKPNKQKFINDFKELQE